MVRPLSGFLGFTPPECLNNTLFSSPDMHSLSPRWWLVGVEKRNVFFFVCVLASIEKAMLDWRLEATFVMQLSKQGSQVSPQQAPEQWWCSLIGWEVTLRKKQQRDVMNGWMEPGYKGINEAHGWISMAHRYTPGLSALKKPETCSDWKAVRFTSIKTSHCSLFWPPSSHCEHICWDFTTKKNKTRGRLSII